MKLLERSPQVPPTHLLPTTGLTLEVLRTEEGLESLEHEWRQLARALPSKTPYHEWDYLMAWWGRFGRRCPVTNRKGRLFVVVVRQDSRAVGIVPFFWIPRGPVSLLPARLRAMGYSGRLEPYDMTEEPLVLMEVGREVIVLEAVQQALDLGLSSGEWDCAVLRWLGPEGSAPSRHWTRVRRKHGSGYVTLPQTWEQLRSRLSRSMRDNLPYYARLLTRRGHGWHVETVCGGHDSARGLDELVRLHRLRTWSSNDPARRDHLPLPVHRKFLEDLHRTSNDGRAFIGLLRVDGQVVAAQSYLDDGRTLLFSYSGHDPAWGSFSPLLVLQAEIIKGAIQQGVERLDLLSSGAQWQERWQPTRDFPVNKLVVVAKRPGAAVRCALYLALRETSIAWEKSRLNRRIKRARLRQSAESVIEAIAMAHSRHPHLFAALHHLHARG